MTAPSTVNVLEEMSKLSIFINSPEIVSSNSVEPEDFEVIAISTENPMTMCEMSMIC